MLKLKMLLTDLNITQKKLAAYLGKHEMTIWLWLNRSKKHKIPPHDADKIIGLMKQYGVDLSYDNIYSGK